MDCAAFLRARATAAATHSNELRREEVLKSTAVPLSCIATGKAALELPSSTNHVPVVDSQAFWLWAVCIFVILVQIPARDLHVAEVGVVHHRVVPLVVGAVTHLVGLRHLAPGGSL